MEEIPMERRCYAQTEPRSTASPHSARLGGARSNFGVDDGLLEGGQPPRRQPAAADGEFGVDDGLLGGNSPPSYPRPNPEDDFEDVDVERDAPPPYRPPRPRIPSANPNEPKYPLAPPESSDDRFYVNYATRKNIAQGMMDVSLLTANASQLRYIMRAPYWDIYHKVNFGLITFNIILQIVVGVALIFVGRFDYKRVEDRKRTQTMSSVVVSLIFAITVVNIFIATFGVDDERTTFMRWTKAHEPHTMGKPDYPAELDFV